MQLITNPLFPQCNPYLAQDIGLCFYIAVPHWSDTLREERASLAPVIESQVSRFLSEEICFDEFCDLVENDVGILNMDAYIEEIAENLEDLCQIMG